MPLTRYQIRNEYGLADPELYKAADKDDPEALLEGVAMAGLVGVLRQLGDLAEFAAEIFHDLHEDLMTTAARGHGLMVRVQQLEAEFPSIEKAFLSQTSHSSFFYNTGTDWHPNLHMDQNLITQRELPRFVMDSYEECRGPPRLFLLDKFDVAGAGACLKRYTDPSLFKVETSSAEIPNAEVQREKKRKAKKKGSRWKSGETPDVLPASHAKLHQLFLEDRVEKGIHDPARRVKLKRKLNGYPFDSKTGKSYMDRFLDPPSPDHNVVREISVCSSPLRLPPSGISGDSELEIIEISAISPDKESCLKNGSPYSSPDIKKTIHKPSMEEFNERTLEMPKGSPGIESDYAPETLGEVLDEKEIAVDEDNKSDDIVSDVDYYVDALATMEPEIDTDTECKAKNDRGFLNVKKQETGPDANEEQADFSVGNSTASDHVSHNVLPSSGNCEADIVNRTSGQCSDENEIPSTQPPSHGHSGSECIEVLEIPSYRSEIEEPSSNSCLTDVISHYCPVDEVDDELAHERKSAETLSDSSTKYMIDSLTDSPRSVHSNEEAQPLDSMSSPKFKNCNPDINPNGVTFTVNDAISSDDGEVTEIGKDPVSPKFTPDSPDVPDLSESHLDDLVNGTVQPEVPAVASPASGCEHDGNSNIYNVDSQSQKESHSIDGDSPKDLLGINEPCIPHSVRSRKVSYDYSNSEAVASPASGCEDDGNSNIYNVDSQSQEESHSIDGDSPKNLSGINEPCIPHSVRSRKVSYDYSISDSPNDIPEPYKPEDADPSIVSLSSAESDQDSESKLPQQSNLAEKSEDSVCSPNHYIPDLKIPLEQKIEPEILEQPGTHELDVSKQATDPLNSHFPTLGVLPVATQNNFEEMPPLPPLPPMQWRMGKTQHHASLPSETELGQHFLCQNFPRFPSAHALLPSETELGQHLLGQNFPTLPTAHSPLPSETELGQHLLGQNFPRLPTAHASLPSETELGQHLFGQIFPRFPTIPDGKGQLDFPALEGETRHLSNKLWPLSAEKDDHRVYGSLAGNVVPAMIDQGKAQLDFPAPEGENRHLSNKLLPLSAEKDDHRVYGSLAGNVVPAMVDHGKTGLDFPALEIENRHLSNKLVPLSADEKDDHHFYGSLAGNVVPPLVDHGKARLDFPALGGENRHLSDKLLPLSAEKEDNLVYGSLAGNVVPAMVDHGKAQLDFPALERENLHLSNKLLPLAAEKDDHHVYESLDGNGFESVDGVTQQSNMKQISPLIDSEDTGSLRALGSSQEPVIIKPLYIFAPEKTLENENLLTSTILEEKAVNPLDRNFPSPNEEEERARNVSSMPEGETPWSTSTSTSLQDSENWKTNGTHQKKILRPRNPLIHAVVAHDKSKLRKVTDRVRPQIEEKPDERDSLLEQIRTKSFNLKPAVVTRPSIQGPQTNLKLAAILEKANAIRQALAGSDDEDDDPDSWSE